MKKFCIVTGSLFSVLMIYPQAFAMESKGEITLKAGTLGGGIEFVKPINENFSIGLGANGYTDDETLDESGVNYDAELELKTISLIANYHPWGGNFRMSGGVMYNGNNLSVTALPSNGTFEFNGVNYSTTDVGSVLGEVDFNNMAPYVGFGWGKAPASTGWAMELNVGALYQGTPDVSLTATCGTLLTAPLCAQLESDVALEQSQLQEDLDSYTWYPVVSLGVSYMF